MSTQSQERTDAFNVRPPYPAAVSLSGPDWHSGLAHGDRVVLSRPEVQFGRMEANDVVLSDPNASRQHAVIRWTPNGYVIQDSGSSNGTYVEGHRVVEPVMLVPGQHIVMGTTNLLFEPLTAGPAADTRPAPGYAPQVMPAAAPPSAQLPPWPASGTAAMPVQGAFSAAAPAESRFALWLQRQRPKRYWKIFLVGMAGYIAGTILLNATHNDHLVPMVLLLGSAIIPISFVRFCVDEGAFADMPVHVIGYTFVSGAVMGLILAAILESTLLGNELHWYTWFIVGFCEETAKAAAVVWFIRNKSLRTELDGLVLGAAAGMGFAALETAGYGFDYFISSPNIPSGIESMTHELILRMTLALFGHGVWTAIICAAIWRERGQSTFRLTGGVVLAFAISVCLHGLWDWNPIDVITGATSHVTGELGLDVVVILELLPIGFLGLLILRFFIRESLERAALGPMAPPPPPLAVALAAYIAHPFGRGSFSPSSQQSEKLMATFNAAAPVSGPAPSGPYAAQYPQQASSIPQPAPQQAMPCLRCGTRNPPDSRFCTTCGNALK